MITINLFDVNFAQSECSVAWATPKTMRYVRGQGAFNGVTLFTDGYVFDGTVDTVDSKYKIGWLHEPACLWPRHYQLDELPLGFDLILTYYQPLIDRWPYYKVNGGFKFAPYGGIWVKEQDWHTYPKSKDVSMLYGDKLSTDGHRIRHRIGEALADVDYYGWQGTPVNYSSATKLWVHKDYRYSIVVETCREDNLFTEILLDCMMAGTVPVFWGAPNIGAFFNEDGIISFETVDELKDIIPTLTETRYASMMKAVMDNFHTAQEYAITEDWMVRVALDGYV
jgi:hypothetical protein